MARLQPIGPHSLSDKGLQRDERPRIATRIRAQANKAGCAGKPLGPNYFANVKQPPGPVAPGRLVNQYETLPPSRASMADTCRDHTQALQQRGPGRPGCLPFNVNSPAAQAQPHQLRFIR